MKKVILMFAVIAVAISSFAGNGDIGSVGNDVTTSNVRKLVLADKAVKALYQQYNSKNYNKGCTNTEVQIDLKSMSFEAHKSCYFGDSLSDSTDIIIIKGSINPYSEAKSLESIQIKSIEFQVAG